MFLLLLVALLWLIFVWFYCHVLFLLRQVTIGNSKYKEAPFEASGICSSATYIRTAFGEVSSSGLHEFFYIFGTVGSGGSTL